MLFLREQERMPCGEIGLVLGIGRAAAAALAWRAREALHPAAGAAAGVCGRARTALELAADGESPQGWVGQHVRGCPTCQGARSGWSAVSAAYRDRLGIVRAPGSAGRALRIARAQSNMR